MKLNKQFWSNQRVLVTGHTGFKGAWLCQLLSQLKARVFGYALAPDAVSLYNILDPKINSIIGDLLDFSKLNSSCQEIQPTILIHMAAQAIVSEAFRKPVANFNTNVMGTVHLLEAARKCKQLKAILVVTTDKVYGASQESKPFLETDPLNASEPYAASKACAELVTASFRNCYFDTNNVGLSTARSGNVIGGGDYSANRIIPDLINSIMHEKPLQLRNPEAVRPWQYVLEPLFGYLLLLEQMYYDPKKFSGAWNFGPTANLIFSVQEIANNLALKFNSKLNYQLSEQICKEESLLLLNSAKAEKYLHWENKLDIDTILELIHSWYLAKNKKAATIEQIEYYFNNNFKLSSTNRI